MWCFSSLHGGSELIKQFGTECCSGGCRVQIVTVPHGTFTQPEYLTHVLKHGITGRMQLFNAEAPAPTGISVGEVAHVQQLPMFRKRLTLRLEVLPGHPKFVKQWPFRHFL